VSATTAGRWHRGELAAQARAGVDPARSAAVAAFLRPFLNEQHRAFWPLLPFVVAGAVDDEDRPWATILEGGPGFVRVPDERHLRLAAAPAADDPARPGLAAGRPVGLLGIQLETRRRNRMNGRIVGADAGALELEVGVSFGNCPKYIHTRTPAPVDAAAHAPAPAEAMDGLDDEARAAVARARTFFVASYADEDGRGVDVSHRGGRPGFVGLERDADGEWLVIPDFAGNQFFNTLGNLLASGRAGLLFPDFESGDVLQLSGAADVLFDGPRVAAFAGAERLWRVRPERVVRRRGALRWRAAVDEVSPFVAPTGTWAEARAAATPAAAPGWRAFEVVQVVDEAAAVRSFHLKPVDAAAPVAGEAGMHVVLRLPGEDGAPPLVRSYSLSRLPADGGLRISVKADGAGSRAVHRRLVPGTRVELRGPQGEFTPGPASQRPVVLASAGIGITPMRAMAERLVADDLAAGRRRAIHFVHGARDGAAMPFGAELAALRERADGRLHLLRAFSRPRPADVEGRDFERRGHVDIALLAALPALADADVYLCGPALFMQELYDDLRAAGLADERLHAESFGPASLRRTGAPPAPVAAAGPVPVRFLRAGVEATWRSGEGTLLELAERAGLQPEWACREGSCGTCRTRVAAGAVAYPDRAPPAGPAGSALICCAVPAAGAADGLALDL
jgi:ferredoxin-NADP reductase/predicted pyridoxine 5'-phosphate oxidase superfamily flavin-nucleotide-binding protein